MHGVSSVALSVERLQSWPRNPNSVFMVLYVILIKMGDYMDPRRLPSSTFSMLLIFRQPTVLPPAHSLSVLQDHSLTTPFTKRSSFTLLKAPMRSPNRHSR